MWTACEALLCTPSEPRSMRRALIALQRAFDCDGVSLHALGPSGEIEPWTACGHWDTDTLRACMSIPLFRGEERVGTLDLVARPGASWTPEQKGLVRTAAGTLGAALGARIELMRLRHLPGRDPLTGLPDGGAFRARLIEELARARRHGTPVAVVSLDIDHFEKLNARHGRDAGDAVLAESALVLRLTLRESDVVARFGGDGFAILLPETDLPSAIRCSDRVRRALEEHRFARVGRISLSAGVASSPRDGVEGIELLEASEQALALAKKAGRRRSAASARLPVH